MSVANAETIEEVKARNKELIKEVLEVYPEKPQNAAPNISAPSKMESRTAA